MKVLSVGDIVGSPGRKAIERIVPEIVEKEDIEFVIANGENAAGGSGLTPSICDELFSYGIDVLTSGDHIWKKRDIFEYLNKNKRVLRPLNYPEGSPGSGYGIYKTKSGSKIAVINLIGRVFMEPIESPFLRVMPKINEIRETTKNIVIDFHAEATSEKIALGYYLESKTSAVIGTHTHVQTADEKILPGKTAYITDCGMTGPFSGVIGRKKEQILERFITQLPTRFVVADNDIRLNGVIIDIDESTGQARSITRVDRRF